MIEQFGIYFQPNKEEMNNIWNEAIFVVDTNVLLNLYRYSEDTTSTFTDIIQKLSKRFWIPHQVALEYNVNRINVINEQKVAYQSVRKSIETETAELITKIEAKLKKYQKRHPVINSVNITSKIENVTQSIVKELEDLENDHPNYIYEDPIRNLLGEYVGNKIGEPYTQVKLDEIFKEGAERYAKEFPPGYADLKEKEGKFKYYKDIVLKDEYVDLVVWKQILDFAVIEQKNIIFVTDDNKPDWWLKDHGKTVGPRTELLNEFNTLTGKRFLMYESDRFMEYAQNYLSESVNEAAIQEVSDFLKTNQDDNNALTYLNEYYYNNKVGDNLFDRIKNGFSEFDIPDSKRIEMLLKNYRDSVTSSTKENIINIYNVNDKVNHNSYGNGKILNVVDDGVGDKLLMIHFEGENKLRSISEFSPFLQKSIE